METHREQSTPQIPRWLRFVLTSDRAGSSWYVGLGFFFAPALAIVSPWPAVTTVIVIVIAVAGLWLGLLGLAMAAGLAMVLRTGADIPEDYWRSILDYPDGVRSASKTVAPPDVQQHSYRCSRPASA